MSAAPAFWHPIATAPKDGSEVLLFSPGNGRPRILVGSWEDQETRSHGKVLYSSQKWRASSLSIVDDDPQPTHWAPIPPPPADAEAPR